MRSQDRLVDAKTASNKSSPFIVLIVALLVTAGGWYLYTQSQNGEEAETVAVIPPPPPELPPIEAAPDIPVPPTPILTETEEAIEIIELPALDDSDAFARELILKANGSDEIALWAQTDSIIQKSAALIDGMSKGVMLKKILPIQPPAEKFMVSAEDGLLWMDERGFQRYDDLVGTVTSIEPDTMATIFHTLRPLLEQALAQLGLPAETLDNRLITALDLILAAPDISGPIALKQESVYYQFQDPELESLPGTQKQMLRIGPQNRAAIKQYVKKVRTALLTTHESSDN
jgi:hypothetical protein